VTHISKLKIGRGTMKHLIASLKLYSAIWIATVEGYFVRKPNCVLISGFVEQWWLEMITFTYRLVKWLSPWWCSYTCGHISDGSIGEHPPEN